jgi:hypothetical protein
MKVLAGPRQSSQQTVLGGATRLTALVLTALLVFLGISTRAAVPIRLDSPTAFFTNVATRLLKSELNLDLSQLQVYPTNQYTPAVHRLLQITANLYDSTTNRALGLAPEYPYCPSVFRPLFRRVANGTNASIVIAGYREVNNSDMADSSLAPIMIDLDQPSPPLQGFPLYGAPFLIPDRNEPMVSGIPLVIGAKTGFPNFNGFSMQTQVAVSRFLEFRRATVGSNGPVVETNQMYVVGISNAFGLEAWNSYVTNYPRDLSLSASVYMTAIITNESGAANVLLSNSTVQAASFLIPANSWSGWTTPQSAISSMVLPFGTTNGFFFLTNSTYVNNPPWFIPQTHVFTRGSGLGAPHWWLNLNTRLLFILVDTNADRIVDYVNLSHTEPSLDITAKLGEGDDAINPGDYRNPANEWLTNSVGSSSGAVTYGIINQIQVGLNGTTDWQNYSQDPYAGLDAESAVDGFRYNLGNLGPIYPKDVNKVFYKSNVFYAPFTPYRPIYIHTSWQANDPLVHYTVGDLVDRLTFDETNRVDFFSRFPDLGRINNRYSPWGGNPSHIDPTTDVQMAVKDPGITRSDVWNFPTNQSLGIDWVGRVHRGTPWQTIFLKSTNILLQAAGPAPSLMTWARWTGNPIMRPNWLHPDILVFDALFTAPTNDWHLVSLLNDFFNTNDIRLLASPNQPAAQAWEALLDGMVVFTNPASGQLTSVTMFSNSPQAALIAEALLNTRASQPGQVFLNIGDIVATPELSIASPWLTLARNAPITDEIVESMPSQLLPLLRPDSIGELAPPTSDPPRIQFTGMDGYNYTVQRSSDLLNWTSVSTNAPENGAFNFVPSSPDASAQFYRSVLQF